VHLQFFDILYLENMPKPFTVAALAIISHTFVTVLVLFFMTQSFTTGEFSHKHLAAILIYNFCTIILHMSYRVWEKKLVTTIRENSVLLFAHILTSLGALVHGYIALVKVMDTGLYLTACILWGTSLLTGLIIFYRRYKGDVANLFHAM
jgi:hypothetical protein